MKTARTPIVSAVFARLRRLWLTAFVGLVASAGAQVPALDSFYASNYSITQLGSAPGVPGNYGGLTFKAGDPDILLIGGAANNASAAIYAVSVVRGTGGHITGFSGTATLFAQAGNIDGGLTYGPGGVLFYATYSNHNLGQIKPGSTVPDKLIELGPLGVPASTGSIAFVPPGFPNAGHMKILSYSAGTWQDAQIVADAAGTFDVVNVSTRHSRLPAQPAARKEPSSFPRAIPSFRIPAS
jgi:hypothetical protein